MDCLSHISILRRGWKRDQLTNIPAITLFSHGRPAIPSLVIVFITYNNVTGPGTSIVNQAIFPGILNLLFADVFPAPYHGITHCIRVIYQLSAYANACLDFHTIGKNVKRDTTRSQFSLDGGNQFSTRAMMKAFTFLFDKERREVSTVRLLTLRVTRNGFKYVTTKFETFHRLSALHPTLSFANHRPASLNTA